MVGALDIGGTKTIVGLVGEDGAVLASEQFATDTADCAAHLARCAERLRRMARARGVPPERLPGVGAALPGVVDAGRERLVRSAYPAWNGLPVRRMLREATGCPRVAVDNDVNACALAELRFGHRGRFSDFLWVTVSTGVGGAVVCGGRLVRGAGGFAGEVGHIRVERDRPRPCPACGGSGCLEAHASGRALGGRFAAAAAADPGLAERLRREGLEPDARACARLAREGDPAALACCEEAGGYLGRGLAAAVNLLNPQALVLGGGVGEALPLLAPALLRRLREETHPALWPVELLQTGLGYRAALIGAAALALEQTTED